MRVSRHEIRRRHRVHHRQGQDSSAATRASPVLATLKAAGQLAVSGPFVDDYGALIVYEANSKEDAEKLLRGDPFHENGIFVRWVMRPWNPVIANRELFPA
jgi:uncharacterized protein YciI